MLRIEHPVISLMKSINNDPDNANPSDWALRRAPRAGLKEATGVTGGVMTTRSRAQYDASVEGVSSALVTNEHTKTPSYDQQDNHHRGATPLSPKDSPHKDYTSEDLSHKSMRHATRS